MLAAWRIAVPVDTKGYNQYINANQTVYYLKYNFSDPDDNKPFEPYTNQSTYPYSPIYSTKQGFIMMILLNIAMI